MNVTEQSMLSSYASGEILSARQKADNGRPKGDVIAKRSFPKREEKVPRRKNHMLSLSLLLVGCSLLRRRSLVTGDTPTATAVCGYRHADGISPGA